MSDDVRRNAMRSASGLKPLATSVPGPGVKAQYRQFVDFVLLHPRFVSSLASVITDLKLVDELQEALTVACKPAEALEVIKSLLRTEFERKAVKEPGSILRGASLAAKMSSRHARTVGMAYLCELFGGWVQSMIPLPELNVAVPEDKSKLIEMTDAVIAVMSAERNVDAIPYDIREMARLIGSLCDTYLPDQKWPLVGGLVLLRLYSPTLISPTTFGLLPADFAVSTALRKNLTQVTRLLQNASNHQPFKDGVNTALNEWVEEAGRNIDRFLARVVSRSGPAPKAATASGDEGATAAAPSAESEAAVLKLVQLFVQHKAKVAAELEGCAEDFKPIVRRFDESLGACGNPFRQRTGTVAKASEVLSLTLGGLASKRALDQDAFSAMLTEYRWPCPYLREYFAAGNGGRDKDKTVFLCSLLSNDKKGVPCAPKVGKKENHLVFVGRDAIDWLVENLGLAEREAQCVPLLQDMCDLELIVPWQTEKREKKSGVRFEDGDRFYWFDYAALAGKRRADPASAPAADDRGDMRQALAHVQLDKLGRAGILEQARPAGGVVEETSSREQWRMLLSIAWHMAFSDCGVVKGFAPTAAGATEDKPFFGEFEADVWCRRFLGFGRPAQTSELLKVLQNDGFVFEKDGRFGFHWQKIKQWNEKTFGGDRSRSSTGIAAGSGITPRGGDAPVQTQQPPTPKGSSQQPPTPKGGSQQQPPTPKGGTSGSAPPAATGAKPTLSLRGKMGQSRGSIDRVSGSSDNVANAPSQPQSETSPPLSPNPGADTTVAAAQRVSAFATFRRNNSQSVGAAAAAAPDGGGTTKMLFSRRSQPSLERRTSQNDNLASSAPSVAALSRHSGIPVAIEEDESSGDDRNSKDDDADVSMMDFLNMDPDEVAAADKGKGKGAAAAAAPAKKTRRGIFGGGKKPAAVPRGKSAGGLFGRKKDEE